MSDDTIVRRASADAPRRAEARSVSVRTEVAALPRAFDYVVPDSWSDDVAIGTRVRVPLHGRSVRGWVVDEDPTAPGGVDLLPLKAWLGWGPPPGVVDLGAWASWRWAGPQSFFLRIGSPAAVVRSLPAVPHDVPGRDGRDAVTGVGTRVGTGVVRGGRGHGAVAAGDGSDRPCPLRRRSGPHRARHRERTRPRPLDRVGRATCGPPPPARLPGGRLLGGGVCRMAGGRREPGRGLGAGSSSRGRRRPRRARRLLS